MRFRKLGRIAVPLALVCVACRSVPPAARPSADQRQPLACADPAAAPAVEAPPAPRCANPELTRFDRLLVLAPHPDDEVLGFAGLITAYRDQGKPVEVVVTTDGDAYCEACRLWKTSSVSGSTCSAAELSNFTTAEVDSFAEVRHRESTAAAAILGLGPPSFWGYPDTGLGAAWRNHGAGEPGKPLRRSDFSNCRDCETCEGGYGEGPATRLTAATLIDALRQRLAEASDNALVATTHWLDGHGDHAGLGSFVAQINGELERPRAVAYAVIHAHTPKSWQSYDCWYPAPAAVTCPCLLEERCATADPEWIARLRAHRFRPDWPAALPDDAGYGEEKQLCLAERLYAGEAALKLAAVRAFGSQLGTLARNGSHPPGLEALMDCNGYLTSFVRRTEAFVLVEPGATGATPPPAAAPGPDDRQILAAFDGLRVADVSDGMDAAGLQDVGLVDPEIKALWRDVDDFSHRMVGIAATVRYVPTNRRAGRMTEEEFAEWEGEWYDKLSGEPFVEHLRPGSVVVIDGDEDGDTGSIGSYNILAWKLAGAVGVVTSGGVRDTDEIIKQRVPLYHRRLGRGIRPGRNEVESVGRPVTIGGVLVRPGDVVVADGDGVIVVPREQALAVARVAHRILASDKEGRRELYRKLGLPADKSVAPETP